MCQVTLQCAAVPLVKPLPGGTRAHQVVETGAEVVAEEEQKIGEEAKPRRGLQHAVCTNSTRQCVANFAADMEA